MEEVFDNPEILFLARPRLQFGFSTPTRDLSIYVTIVILKMEDFKTGAPSADPFGLSGMSLVATGLGKQPEPFLGNFNLLLQPDVSTYFNVATCCRNLLSQPVVATCCCNLLLQPVVATCCCNLLLQPVVATCC